MPKAQDAELQIVVNVTTGGIYLQVVGFSYIVPAAHCGFTLSENENGADFVIPEDENATAEQGTCSIELLLGLIGEFIITPTCDVEPAFINVGLEYDEKLAPLQLPVIYTEPEASPEFRTENLASTAAAEPTVNGFGDTLSIFG